MTPVLIRLYSDTPFTRAVPVAAPLGAPVAQTCTALHHDLPTQQVATGIWECTPGTWRRQVMQGEYSYFISGEGSFTPDDGSAIEFRSGDAIYFAPDTPGVWEIRQTVRKAYLILG